MLLSVPLMALMKIALFSELVPSSYRDPILVILEGDRRAPQKHGLKATKWVAQWFYLIFEPVLGDALHRADENVRRQASKLFLEAKRPEIGASNGCSELFFTCLGPSAAPKSLQC